LAELTSPPATPSRHRRLKRALVILVVALVAVAGYLFLKPVGIPAPDGSAVRPMTWSEARAAVADIQAREAADPTIQADCHTRLYDHGERTERVIVLLHGYTNCPKQDDELAGKLADLGYTVYVPLMPHHGQVPERRGPLGSLKADEIAAYGDEAMDIANGLGDELSVLGLSGGGLVASYIAQYRADADLVVPIAAFLGPPSPGAADERGRQRDRAAAADRQSRPRTGRGRTRSLSSRGLGHELPGSRRVHGAGPDGPALRLGGCAEGRPDRDRGQRCRHHGEQRDDR
jgi:alpha-beta hydrolase superfamily lysophospholipase